RSPLTIRGEFDRAHQLGEERASDGSEVRYVGGYMYVPVVEAMRKAYEAVGRPPIPAGKTWLRLPAPEQIDLPAIELLVIGGSTNGLGQVDPENLLALLQHSSQVSEHGPVSGPGWTGTAYAFTASVTTRGPLHLTLSSTGTVDVDRQGRVRQLDATQTFGKNKRKVQVTFGDFGLAVPVSPPPASETYTPPAGNLGPSPTLSPSPTGR
ncbi:MAG TPA: hypothetical protein VFQ68_06820, partial [Streptosporangiaceae bacterium]|nr:hypothetical protein [Streptosporangiaceae bacterium]